jgi:hypothetical protein
MKIRDEVLEAYMNEKLKPEHPSPLQILKRAAQQRVEVKGLPELVAFLKKKVFL